MVIKTQPPYSHAQGVNNTWVYGCDMGVSDMDDLKWKPIETADKQRKSEEDHVDILLWDGIRQAVGYWDDTSYSTEEFVKETKSGKRVYQMVEYVSGYWHVEGDFLSPTHWMPLPEPPIEE